MNTPLPISNHSPARFYFAASVLALAIVGGMLYVLHAGNLISHRLGPQQQTTQAIAREVALAQIRFEEYMLSGGQLRLNAYLTHMETAQRHTKALLNGEDTTAPLEGDTMREQILAVLTQLKALRNVAAQRLMQDRGTDQEIHKSFNAIYATLTTRLDRMNQSVGRAMASQVRVFEQTQQVLIFVCLVLAAIVCTMMLRLHRRMERSVALLSQRDELLRRHADDLEGKNRELEQFAYVASHDLQEPLRKIRAFGDRLQLKEAAKLSATGQDYLVRMQAAAGRMQALIEGLLLYSRCGTRAQAMCPVDLDQVARGAVSDLETRIQESRAEIRISPLPTIRADAMQMGQLFQNMLSNGLKFHAADQAPRLSVTSRVHDHGIDLCFTDNGIGIHPDQSERIFQVFQRLHGRDAYQGAGVGLSICKKAVERHGGSIELTSEPGRGSTFTVHLPITPSVLEETAPPSGTANGVGRDGQAATTLHSHTA